LTPIFSSRLPRKIWLLNERISFRQQVETVTHVVELLNFVQDRIRMHGDALS
jgi:hypothetical protein